MQGKIRFIPYNRYDPLLNMALDQLLLDGSDFVLRFYGWSQPTLSLGKSQKVIDDLDLDFAQKKGLAIVRRATGGQTVLHDQELTYSVVGSTPPFPRGVIESYKMIAIPLRTALISLGAKVELAGINSSEKPKKFKPTSSHCFLEPSAHEIMVEGKKLIGSAQKRSRGRLLQHGSIPVNINRKLWGKIWPDDDGNRYISLSEALSRKIEVEELFDPLKMAFSESFGLELVEQDFSPEELAHAAELVKKNQT